MSKIALNFCEETGKGLAKTREIMYAKFRKALKVSEMMMLLTGNPRTLRLIQRFLSLNREG